MAEIVTTDELLAIVPRMYRDGAHVFCPSHMADSQYDCEVPESWILDYIERTPILGGFMFRSAGDRALVYHATRIDNELWELELADV